jgi:hypothetical protein
MLRKRIIDFEETVELVPAEEPTARRDMSDEPNTGNGWARVRVLENCEVNGMRLPEGIIVDVSAEDAQRLIDSGHAELREAAEPDLSEDDGEFDASESADLPDSEDDADDADAEDAPEPEDEADETDDEADETDDEADEVAEADTPDEETLAAAEIADDAEADAPDAESAPDAEAVPDEQVLDTSDHALATAIAETAEAFNEIDVALAADISEEQAASDDENKTGDEADADAEADET